jgi:hypothetical protein
MPDPKDYADRRDFQQSVLRHIPGFRGYLEREYRRESDQLLRNWLTDRLQRSKRPIDELSRQLVDAGQLEALAPIDRLRAQLDQLIGRMRGAMQGYSGFFDLVRVDVPLLDRIYEHDANLNQKVDSFTQTAEQLPSKQKLVSTTIAEMLRQLDDIRRQWDEREDMLKGVK